MKVVYRRANVIERIIFSLSRHNRIVGSFQKGPSTYRAYCVYHTIIGNFAKLHNRLFKVFEF